MNGAQQLHKGNKEEMSVFVAALPERLSWGGVESAGQQGFYLFDAGRAFKGRGLLMVSVCECKSQGSKSQILRGGVFVPLNNEQNEQ